MPLFFRTTTLLSTEFLFMIYDVKRSPRTRALPPKPSGGRGGRTTKAGVAHGSHDNRCDNAVPEHRRQHHPNIRQGIPILWPPYSRAKINNFNISLIHYSLASFLCACPTLSYSEGNNSYCRVSPLFVRRGSLSLFDCFTLRGQNHLDNRSS